MNLRWLWFDHVPPGLSLTREERINVRRRARKARKRDPSYRDARFRFNIVYMPVALGVGALYMFLVLSDVGHHLSITLLYFAVCGIVGTYAHYRTHAPFIRRALHDYGHEVCIECGYLLRGLDDEVERCPECGAERDRELLRIARENHLPETRTRRDDRPPRWERNSDSLSNP